MYAKRITNIAMLSAIALTIFMVEAQIPPLVPISGVKMGLANIITVYAMFVLGPKDTFFILICRIFLGSMFSGQMMSLLYSFSGGMMCYVVMLIMRKIVSIEQIWVCSILGAIAHNIGQIAMAILVTGTVGIIVYFPVLLISGIIAGTFTGFCAQYLVKRMI